MISFKHSKKAGEATTVSTANEAANHSSQFSTLCSQLLKRYWGYDSFRGIQREIIESIMAGHDTLGLMPTGGGKSITFQVPALALEGTCIVITPLIALMKDQVQHLRQRGIRAAAIYTGLSHDEVLRTLENAVFGAVKLLYISPERLSSELFQQKLRHIKVNFICVDEAHCISQWGYDFRPSYLAIAKIRSMVPDAAVLALTATATATVIDDIQDKLTNRERSPKNAEGPAFNVFRMSFERKNLAYIVRHVMSKPDELTHLLTSTEGSTIVYTRSRKRTREYAEMLTQAGLSATYFHAGLDNAEKDRRQQAWQRGDVRIIVCTNAFGMGIDKPDVRLVVHADCPDSIEAYFQEAGRAGRDGQEARAIMLCNGHDVHTLRKHITEEFPPKEYIRKVYDHLAYFYQVGVGSGYNATFEFPIDKFCATFRHFPVHVKAALKILDRAGYIDYIDEEENQGRVMFTLERDDLYRLRGNSAAEDKVVETLLRNYTGLFVDYRYIDEAFLAQQTGMTQPQVYQTLKLLSQKKVLHFIPQKKTPYVRYSQRREDSEHLIFPPDVYDELRERYVQRIRSMVEYMSGDGICRSRLLLRYFGETKSSDCGHCDVCLSRQGDVPPTDEVDVAEQQIRQLLADGRPHPIDDLHSLKLDLPVIGKALSRLVDELEVINDDGVLHLP